jgi:hypothetical protein
MIQVEPEPVLLSAVDLSAASGCHMTFLASIRHSSDLNERPKRTDLVTPEDRICRRQGYCRCSVATGFAVVSHAAFLNISIE